MLLTGSKPDGSPVKLRLKTMAAGGPVSIGRGSEADVTIEDGRCSRIHCEIRYWDDIFVVKDCQSRNGTFVNGKKVEVAKLSPNDVLKIGDTELTAQSEETAKDVTMAG
jgi:pSer/pThr/pTyr-binding forkhead associated (FHA) protein